MSDSGGSVCGGELNSHGGAASGFHLGAAPTDGLIPGTGGYPIKDEDTAELQLLTAVGGEAADVTADTHGPEWDAPAEWRQDVQKIRLALGTRIAKRVLRLVVRAQEAEVELNELRVKFEHREEQFHRLLEFSATNASPPLDDEDYRRATNDMPEKLAVGDVPQSDLGGDVRRPSGGESSV